MPTLAPNVEAQTQDIGLKNTQKKENRGQCKEEEQKGEIEKYIQRLEEKIQKKENYFRGGKCKDYHDEGGCRFTYHKMFEVNPGIYWPNINIRCKCANCGIPHLHEREIPLSDIENFLKELTTEPPEVRKRKTIKLIIRALVIFVIILLLIKWLF
jgi:hypothetical protein